MVEPEALSQLLAPIFDPKEWKALPVATKGLPASPGAASGQVVFTADRRGGVDAAGQEGDARPQGDGAGRHPRHVRGAGHPHRDRRHDVARGRRRPPDGQAVGRRRRRAGDRRAREDRQGRRHDAQGRRLALVRRSHRRGEGRPGRDQAERNPAGRQRRDEGGEVRHLPPLQPAAVVGGQVSAGWASARTRTSRIRRRSRTTSARAASASAGPSTCSSAKAGFPSSRR